MSDESLRYETPECYPEGRAVEFALTARNLYDGRTEDAETLDARILEYVVESSHQDGEDSIVFKDLEAALNDLALFLEYYEEEGGAGAWDRLRRHYDKKEEDNGR